MMKKYLYAVCASALLGGAVFAGSASADTNYSPVAVCWDPSGDSHSYASTVYGVMENGASVSASLYCGLDRRGNTSGDTDDQVQVYLYDGSSTQCGSVRLYETNPYGTSTWISAVRTTFDTDGDNVCDAGESPSLGNTTVNFGTVTWHANGIMNVVATLPGVDSSRRSALRGVFLKH